MKNPLNNYLPKGGDILGELSTDQGMVDADGKIRNLILQTRNSFMVGYLAKPFRDKLIGHNFASQAFCFDYLVMNQVNNLIGRKDDDFKTGNEDMKTKAILKKKEDPNYAFRFDYIAIPF